MIPRIRAIAIDDNKEHLEAITYAAKKASIGCLPIHYPEEVSEENFTNLNLTDARLRVIICDYNLNSGSEFSNDSGICAVIGSIIVQMKLAPWTPYVFVLWTGYADKLKQLKEYFEERLPAENLPSLMVALQKNDYGIGIVGASIDSDKLWKDLTLAIQKSLGVNLLMNWENEVLESADGVVRGLMRLARLNPADGSIQRVVSVDSGIDRVVSLVARASTSIKFSKEKPRAAANEGLIPLLSDEIQHLNINPVQEDLWDKALASRKKRDLAASATEAAFFNDAFFIDRTDVITGTHRGAVVDIWHDEDMFFQSFGKRFSDLSSVFGFKNDSFIPDKIKYIQIEGLCDSAQQKSGVVPFILACEVDGATELKAKDVGVDSRPLAVEESPLFVTPQNEVKKIVLNVRYFFTVSRDFAKTKNAEFRIRESLVAKWAYLWANHAIRPGIVDFRIGD
jgi:hypothetical protein